MQVGINVTKGLKNESSFVHSWVGKGQTVVRSAYPIDQQYINIEGSREPPLWPTNPSEVVLHVNTHREKTDGGAMFESCGWG